MRNCTESIPEGIAPINMVLTSLAIVKEKGVFTDLTSFILLTLVRGGVGNRLLNNVKEPAVGTFRPGYKLGNTAKNVTKSH